MDDMPDDEVSRSSLLGQLPADIVASFTPEQRAALWDLSHAPSWRRYPVNIRFNLPLFGRRFFIAMVAGPDRRSDARRERERLINPVVTLPNVLFVASAAAFMAALAAFILFVAQALAGA